MYLRTRIHVYKTVAKKVLYFPFTMIGKGMARLSAARARVRHTRHPIICLSLRRHRHRRSHSSFSIPPLSFGPHASALTEWHACSRILYPLLHLYIYIHSSPARPFSFLFSLHSRRRRRRRSLFGIFPNLSRSFSTIRIIPHERARAPAGIAPTIYAGHFLYSHLSHRSYTRAHGSTARRYSRRRRCRRSGRSCGSIPGR